MGNSRFDELAKVLADSSISRRETIRRLGAGFVGAALASVGIASDAYGSIPCKQVGQKCKANTDCCNGYCDPSKRTCAACPATMVTCAGTCVNVANDVANC